MPANNKKKRKINIQRNYAKNNYNADPDYWGMPLWERIYMRALYATVGFILTGSFFGAFGMPLWIQFVLASCVALAVLLFRMAYPAGFLDVGKWFQEAMEEASADVKKTPNANAKEIIEQQKKERIANKNRQSNRMKK